MLKRVKIRNFQSHSESDLEFVPGVNVIVGQSDSGKSAIVRAINWVLTNRPRGEFFRSVWGGDTEVLIEVDDHEIVRFRSDKANGYILDGLELEAMGSDVPSEISQVLNMDFVNVATQLDPTSSIFMLLNSPGEVGRMMNQAVGFEVIDKSIKKLQSWIREADTKIKMLSEEVEDLEEELKGFEYVEDMKEEFEGLKTRHKELEQLEREWDGLSSMVEEYEEVLEGIEEVQWVNQAEKGFLELWGRAQRLSEYEKRVSGLSNLLGELKAIRVDLSEHKKRVGFEKKLKQIFKKVEKFDELEVRVEKLWGLVVRDVDKLEARIAEERERLESLHEKVKGLNLKVCPLCGQKIEKGVLGV